MLNYFFLVFTYRRKNGIPYDQTIDRKLLVGQALTLFGWCIPCSLLVSYEDAFTYLVPSVFVLALFYAMMYGIQFAIIDNKQYGYKLALLAKLIGPMCCIFMNNFKYGSYDSNLYGMLLGLHYQSMFLA